MKKYEFTGKTMEEDGHTLHQIRAVRDFENFLADAHIHAGALGGWIESEENLSHDGNAWVDEGGIVFDHARVIDNGYVGAGAVVRDNAVIEGDAQVLDEVFIEDNAIITCDAKVEGCVLIAGNALIEDTRDYMQIHNAINNYGGADYTFYRCADGKVRGEISAVGSCVGSCSCFGGTLDELREAARNTDIFGGPDYTDMYVALADFIEANFAHSIY